MSLKSIKLAGFKSFVDVTVIPLRNHLNAIVGPNGCGKSNIVDAIRWVIGESSAKQLRMPSMAEVIFNGTDRRQPVGKAAVELLFDNSSGKIGGEYSRFNEIAVRREVERDGQSRYSINGIVCRRRDVIDIFLGTGLGPRSYAIIEQGMITEFVAANPQEMRQHIEEVAGTSKYKESRRETTLRMEHTQENLNRVNDLLQELTKQCQHLQRQAKTAERYQTLQKELALVQAQMIALQYRDLTNQAQSIDAIIQQDEIQLQQLITKLQNLEQQTVYEREHQQKINESLRQIQENYYQANNKVSRLEQTIQHSEIDQKRWQQDLLDAQQLIEKFEHSAAKNKEHDREIETELNQLRPELTEKNKQLTAVEQEMNSAQLQMQEWQALWDMYQTNHAKTTQEIEVARMDQKHQLARLQQLQQRETQIVQSLSQLTIDDNENQRTILQQAFAELQQNIKIKNDEIQNLNEQILSQRDHNDELNQKIMQEQQQLQNLSRRYTTLDALQQTALGQQDETIKQWLNDHHFEKNPRLGKIIQVENGWEIAIETVLHDILDAVCLQSLDEIFEKQLPQSSMTFVGVELQEVTKTPDPEIATPLINFVKSDWPIHQWLQGIYGVEQLSNALQLRSQLKIHESIVARDGTWLGRNWVRFHHKKTDEESILKREQQLQQIHEKIKQSEQFIEKLTQQLIEGQTQLRQLENNREILLFNQQTIHQRSSQVQADINVNVARLTQMFEQQQRWQNELSQSKQQQELIQQNLKKLDDQIHSSNSELEKIENDKQQLSSQREKIQQRLDHFRHNVQTLRQQSDELNRQVSAIENRSALLKQQIDQEQQQIQQTNERCLHLQHQLENVAPILTQLHHEFNQAQDQRAALEKELAVAQSQWQQHKQLLQQQEQAQRLCLEEQQNQQQQLQQLQLQRQAIIVRQTTCQEQFATAEFDLQTLLAELAEAAEIEQWQDKATRLQQQIQRLGAINLAAIEEHQEVSERKLYLEKQHQDLTEAISILENAIRKIDQQTRQQFHDTFNRIAEIFQNLFPKIFGGGRASLELTENDLMTAGVIVRAQPPGKRNTTIQMLSGGEKALTAISLVFAMFQLNPAPFCILDEVDAPLDDINVGRFCLLVEEMAQQTQFIIVSHNKITISKAQQVYGVTMQEAGVSRVVSVDLKEAIEMAATL